MQEIVLTVVTNDRVGGFSTSPKTALKVEMRLTSINDTRDLTKIIFDDMTNSNYKHIYTQMMTRDDNT